MIVAELQSEKRTNIIDAVKLHEMLSCQKYLDARVGSDEDVGRVSDGRGRAADVGEDDVGDQNPDRICSRV
jgi:hypothetical protein